MKKFVFKLQKVLDYRFEIEEKKKDEFAKAQKKLLSEKNKLESLIERKKSAVEDKSNYKSKLDYQLLLNYIDFMDDKIENQMAEIKKAEDELAIKKDELTKSTADRKVIEKLKEKAKDEFNLEVGQKEQKLNDGFALFSYVRK
ncbi:MAG TPA: flagellar export protein FliJ [Clostridiaceae bacterium]|jgi:flagellar FliJ protein|nr:flagellar export protein FliJ [Clostridiaceae bacterium]HBX49037.1 flagellar export protein FliJ [Clostridiaceae bacterium]HCL50164.1 flagellar export protein FliJ [Clostridiaceae bacterium]